MSIHEIIQQLGQEREHEKAPHISHEVGAFLTAYVLQHRPLRILELWTLHGYSTLCMALGASQYGGHITTIERSSVSVKRAQNAFDRANMQEVITLIQGDAVAWVNAYSGSPFDLVFIDCEKRKTGECLHWILPHLAPWARVIIDDIDDFPEKMAHLWDYLATTDLHYERVLFPSDSILMVWQ